jgi:predicted heme/steroid binding protein
MVGNRRFSRQELSQHNGKDKPTIYIAFNGKVYDVSDNYFWRMGEHYAIHKAGGDMTEELKEAPHGEEMLKNCPIVGFFEESDQT